MIDYRHVFSFDPPLYYIPPLHSSMFETLRERIVTDLTINSNSVKDLEMFEGLDKGALHRELGIPEDQTIPETTLDEIINAEVGSSAAGIMVTEKIKKQALLAKSFRHMHH